MRDRPHASPPPHDPSVSAVAASSATSASPPTSSRFVLTLEDGEAASFADKLKASGVWDRMAHSAPAGAALADLFPPQTAVAFNSPSVLNAFAADVVLGTRGPTSLSRAELQAVSRGAGEFSGPDCLTRTLIRRAAALVLVALVAALAPAASGPDGSLVVGLHLRRGDKAILAECRRCVNEDDPDVKPSSTDRVSASEFDAQLLYVNRTLAQLATRFPRRGLSVFVSSDTEDGMRRATRVLGYPSGPTVLSVRGRAIHSTRTHSSSHELKIAADFLGLAVGDVVLSVGQSSFSGGAAALGGAVVRRVGAYGGVDDGLLREEELKALEAYLRQVDSEGQLEV